MTLLLDHLPPMAEQVNLYVNKADRRIAERAKAMWEIMSDDFPPPRVNAAALSAHLNRLYYGDRVRAYRPRRVRKSKIGPRIDLPPIDQHGPWLKIKPPRSRAAIVEAMRVARTTPRTITAGELVPEAVRVASAERWRREHAALKAQERAGAVVEVKMPSRIDRIWCWLLGHPDPSNGELFRQQQHQYEMRRIGPDPRQPYIDTRSFT